MSDRMDGPRLKVHRAREHLSDLEARHRYFMHPHPYFIDNQCDIKTREQISRVHFLKSIPVEWGLVIGDLFHNLRSSLDLLACQLVLANNGGVEYGTEFPIGRSQKDWENGGKGVRVLNSIDPAAMTILRGLKPYKGGNDTLWAVHRLNIEDKHNLIVPMCTAHTATILLADGPIPIVHDRPGMPPPIPLEEGAIVMRQPAEMADQMQSYFSFDIAFREAPLAGKEMLRTLRELIDQVDGVLNAFHAIRWGPAHEG